MKIVLDRMVLPLAALACLLTARSEPVRWPLSHGSGAGGGRVRPRSNVISAASGPSFILSRAIREQPGSQWRVR